MCHVFKDEGSFKEVMKSLGRETEGVTKDQSGEPLLLST